MTQCSVCSEMKTIHKASTFIKSTMSYIITQISTDNTSLRLFLDAGGRLVCIQTSCALPSMGFDKNQAFWRAPQGEPVS